jgi:poly(3-hydroxyoctanoate) depolymerase
VVRGAAGGGWSRRERTIAWGPGTRVEFVTTAAVPVLRVARAGAGAPLLLISGLGANLEMWRPFVRQFHERELIGFDLPGSGQSARARRPMRMRALSAVVTELLDRLGLARVDVLGYSLGGVLAQELAHRAPHRVRRLVLCATTPGIPSVPPNPLVAALMLSPTRYYSRRLAELIVPVIAGGRTARDPAALRAGLDQRLVQPPTPLGYLYQLYSVWGWSSHPWLRRLRQPTLVLHGDQDPVAPLINARWLASSIPAGRLAIVRGGGHLFLFDEPATAVAAIDSFLGSREPCHARSS